MTEILKRLSRQSDYIRRDPASSITIGGTQIFVISMLFFLLSGCVGHIVETTKSIAGISTKKLEEARSLGVNRIYDAERGVCFDKAIEALNDMGAYIHIRNRKRFIIVAMGFGKLSWEEQEPSPEYDYIDTTEVGFFFEDITNARTKVELSSLSSSLLESISDRFFSSLYKKINNE